MPPVMSACGVLCSDCPAYLGCVKGAEHQKQTAEAWRRIYHLSESPDRITCGGCLGSDDDLFHTSRKCAARRCCRDKGLDSCAECPVEACAALERAQAGWDDVPALADKLSPAEFARYARPYCGHRRRLAALRAAVVRSHQPSR